MNYEKNKGSSLLFLKFIEEQYLNSFLNGNIFVNNFEFFQKLEAKYGIKGIGDKNDGCLPIYNLENVIVKNFENDQVVCKIPRIPVARFSTEEDSKTPLFCLYDMALEDFEVIEDSKNKLRLLLQFDDNKKNIIKNEFKDKTHVVIIDSLLFIDRMVKICNENGLSIDFNRVQYYQKGVNDENRINDFNKNIPNKFFWKEDYFSNQKEFRIVFTNKFIDEGENIINIGEILQISFYMTIDEFLNGKYELVYNINTKNDI